MEINQECRCLSITSSTRKQVSAVWKNAVAGFTTNRRSALQGFAAYVVNARLLEKSWLESLFYDFAKSDETQHSCNVVKYTQTKTTSGSTMKNVTLVFFSCCTYRYREFSVLNKSFPIFHSRTLL